jgi:hypothetical protein
MLAVVAGTSHRQRAIPSDRLATADGAACAPRSAMFRLLNHLSKRLLMRPASPSNLPTESARQFLCHRMSTLLADGACQVRIRLQAEPPSVQFYRHQDNTWRRLEEYVRDRPLVEALADDLEMLASKPHGDRVEIRRQAASHYCDTDFRFEREAISQHLYQHLDSYLYGLLFRDHHDSKQDSRRQMRGDAPHGPVAH